MTDDRTVDADDSAMDELRRLAARARAEQAETDGTVQADDSTMDELRRFAEEARRQAATGPATDVDTSDRTVDADASTMASLRQYAAEARATVAEHGEPASELPAPTVHEPRGTPPPPPQPAPDPGIPTVQRPEPVTAPTVSLDDLTVARTDHEPPHQLTLPATDAHAGESWRPPPRMVMPTEPEKHTHAHHGPWKTIAIVLAGVVAVLAAFVAFSTLSNDGDETPTEGTTPGTTIDETSGERGASGG